ncbi:molybdate ABC transporter substrate-binding protein [Aliiroseovarius subalbicans]|uniref:molybdate ABC transporter substrate-binding protein n=1 Tax=Aliiroseovarius subalbicans TaxID=2925840 RepID=UPI001F56B5CA|nr:molybdate ABC transporter substrate-binding protein [Aliiroseovarius subalbicans]MCI2399667.1 molybdate ABC transporter substrate-binding protein [Aliiroseovarius subalbicans]
MTPPFRQVLILLTICMASLGARAAVADRITVFAAASLKNALEQVASEFERASGHQLTLSLAGSSSLARQIELGAPADVFLSANVGWMDRLLHNGALQEDSRFDLAGNKLVLVAPRADAVQMDLTSLAATLGEGRLAMALVDAVPAGIYGKAAMEHLGLWKGVAPQVAQADNVRAALALVALGEAPFGIVYASDAMAEPRVSVVATFPTETHPPIVYPAAIVAGRDRAAVRAFMSYLRGDQAWTAFAAQGFTPVGVAHE